MLLYPTRDSLPNQPDALKDITIAAFTEIRTYRANDVLKDERIAFLERALYGQKSERMATSAENKNGETVSAVDTGEQNSTEVPSEKVDEAAPHLEKKKTRKPCNRNKDNYHHNGRNAFPEDLLRKRIEYDLDPENKICPHCCSQLTKIGEETVEQLGIIPVKFFVWLHARLKYACRHCCQHVALAKMPKKPVSKGAMSAEVLAFIAMSKYQDFLPLYRIQRQFKRQDLEIARSTLANQMEHIANLFTPIYEGMTSELLTRDHLFTDATRMPFLDPGAGKTKTGRIWTFVGKEGENGQKPLTVYLFAPNCSGVPFKSFLKDFTGYLQTDREPTYDSLIKWDKKHPKQIPPCIQAACWAHVRRKFVEAFACNPSSPAQEALVFIGKLYDIERFCIKEKMKDAAKYNYRQEHSKPVLEELCSWLKQQNSTPSGLLGKAINYTLNGWPYFQTFLEKGFLEIDNNRAERAMKPPVMLRKNSLFAGSKDGGKTAAILLSIFETCNQNGINAFEYMVDVMKRLPTHPKDRIHELFPQIWHPSLTTEQSETKAVA